MEVGGAGGTLGQGAAVLRSSCPIVLRRQQRSAEAAKEDVQEVSPRITLVERRQPLLKIDQRFEPTRRKLIPSTGGRGPTQKK
jgi:hypothetical protein